MMKRAVFLFCFLMGGLLIGSIVQSWEFLRSSGPPRRVPPLAIDRRSLDIGEMSAGATIHRTVDVFNTSSEPVTVRRVSASCDCTNLEPAQFTIAAGGRQQLKFTIDVPHPCTPRRKADFSVPLIAAFETAGREGTVEWGLKGTVISPLLLSAAEVSLGDVDTYREVEHSYAKKITAESNTPLAAVNASTDSSLLEAKATLESPTTLTLAISPNRSARFGPFTAAVGLHATTAAGIQLPTVSVKVRGTFLDPLEFTPSLVCLDPSPVGATVTAAITARARHGEQFVIKPLELDSGRTRVKPVGTTDGSTQVFELTHRVVKEGHYSEYVKFSVSDGDGRSNPGRLPSE